MEAINPFITAFSWDEIAHDVARVEPALANIINQLTPPKNAKLFKIRYFYGDEILKQGIFHVPDSSGQLKSITEADIPAWVRKTLLYNLNSNPVSVILNNSAELYLTLQNRMVPFQILETGTLFGMWGILGESISHHPPSIWNMTAGARSLFMLPKIGDKLSHVRLMKDLNIDSPLPKQLSEHWHVFKSIARHNNNAKPWHMDLLCFSEEWFKILEEKDCHNFRCYLQSKAWKTSAFLRNQAFWNLIFSVIREAQAIPPNAYINDIVKNLFATAVGVRPGFSPAINETSAPITLLQDAYVNGAYRLKNYLPTIMVPTLLNYKNKLPVYLSTQYPTGMEFSEKSNKRPSLIAELNSLYHVMKKYINGILTGNIDISNTKVHQVAKEVNFNFYHEAPALHKEYIFDNNQLFQEDNRFQHVMVDTHNKEFPKNSEFIRACLRVSF